MVINMRLVRRLCTSCKGSLYANWRDITPARFNSGPGSATLSPALSTQRIRNSFRAKRVPTLGYHGRAGIFEVLFVGDNTRQALIATPQLDAVRLAARKDGMRTLQEEGILLVAKGVTSLDELMRALKPA